jgi:hypothetical protein
MRSSVLHSSESHFGTNVFKMMDDYRCSDEAKLRHSAGFGCARHLRESGAARRELSSD